MAKAAKISAPKDGNLQKSISVPSIGIKQFGCQMCLFSMKASVLWDISSINRRDSDKDKGYQRALSSVRVKSVTEYISAKNPITTSILVSIPAGKFDAKTSTLRIPKGENVAWVIDGQHRLAGAHEAAKLGSDIELSVVAVLGQPPEFEINQFVTINKEAKGVPTSLVYELLQYLPPKVKPADIANERAAELGSYLRKQSDSVFNNRIVASSGPAAGQISLVNFVRKVAPFVNPEKGLLNNLTFEQQAKAIDNYFRAIHSVFPQTWKGQKPIVWQTIGFGALMNVFDTVFKETTQRYSTFTTDDIGKILKYVDYFNFDDWKLYGSGNKAELEAASNLRSELSTNLAKENAQQIKL